MISNFKAPNLNAPRYREKVLGLLNIDLINEFKEKWRMNKGESVDSFVIHSTYKRLIKSGTKPSTFFH